MLPLVVPLKLLAFLSLGVYRGLWRFVTINDLLLYIKAVVLGLILSTLALLFLVRFEDYSRTVFVLDGLFLLIMVVGSRLTFRVLRNLLPGPAVSQGRRVLIFGAGDAGMLLLREMRNNPRLGCVPVGFADDDPIKCGKVIGGVRRLWGQRFSSEHLPDPERRGSVHLHGPHLQAADAGDPGGVWRGGGRNQATVHRLPSPAADGCQERSER